MKVQRLFYAERSQRSNGNRSANGNSLRLLSTFSAIVAIKRKLDLTWATELTRLLSSTDNFVCSFETFGSWIRISQSWFLNMILKYKLNLSILTFACGLCRNDKYSKSKTARHETTYLPNKHSRVRRGKWTPSKPFLLIITIFPNNSLIPSIHQRLLTKSTKANPKLVWKHWRNIFVCKQRAR